MTRKSLGIRIDGWADSVEGAHDKAGMARDTFLDLMGAKELPEVSISAENLFISEMSEKKRPFVLLQMQNGVTVAVYISGYGKQLFAAWNLYVRKVVNGVPILVVGVIAYLIGVVNGALSSVISFDDFIMGFSPVFIGACILGLGGVSVAGIVTGRGPFGFFFKQLDAFDADDIGAMTIATHKTVLKALDCVGIPSQSLRVKEQFKGGTRERII